ncbi:MAG: CDP-diacylglycerol--serine O-phosphatidyltransferase, partial [Pseudomonadota bacterium]
PSPSAAALVAAFIWLCANLDVGGFMGLVAAFVVTATAGALMVSNFRYYSFKGISLGRRVSFAYLLLVPLIIALISIHPPLVLFLLFLGYAASGPVMWLMASEPDRVSILDDAVDADDDDAEGAPRD